MVAPSAFRPPAAGGEARDILPGSRLQAGDLGGGDRAWHRRWQAVTHPGIRSSGALSAGKWEAQLGLREWEAVETEWQSLGVGETGRESSVCFGSALPLWMGSLQKSSWNRQGEQEVRGADSFFLYFNQVFYCLEKEERKQKVSSLICVLAINSLLF